MFEVLTNITKFLFFSLTLLYFVYLSITKHYKYNVFYINDNWFSPYILTSIFICILIIFYFGIYITSFNAELFDVNARGVRAATTADVDVFVIIKNRYEKLIEHYPFDVTIFITNFYLLIILLTIFGTISSNKNLNKINNDEESENLNSTLFKNINKKNYYIILFLIFLFIVYILFNFFNIINNFYKLIEVLNDPARRPKNYEWYLLIALLIIFFCFLFANIGVITNLKTDKNINTSDLNRCPINSKSRSPIPPSGDNWICMNNNCIIGSPTKQQAVYTSLEDCQNSQCKYQSGIKAENYIPKTNK